MLGGCCPSGLKSALLLDHFYAIEAKTQEFVIPVILQRILVASEGGDLLFHGQKAGQIYAFSRGYGFIDVVILVIGKVDELALPLEAVLDF